jgi:ABC-type uncharacterized transport system involved in gliding motility auxiliary subunit
MLATGRVSRDEADRSGPVTIAAAAEVPGAEGGAASRVVVIGDSELAVNANLDAYFNRDFLLNATEWLAGRDELIGEAPRGLRPSRLEMTQDSYRDLFRMGVLFLPECILVCGLGVWWWRRSL